MLITIIYVFLYNWAVVFHPYRGNIQYSLVIKSKKLCVGNMEVANKFENNHILSPSD